jgi:hypothetical protein
MTSAKAVRNPPASVNGNFIRSSGTLAGRRIATGSPTKNLPRAVLRPTSLNARAAVSFGPIRQTRELKKTTVGHRAQRKTGASRRQAEESSELPTRRSVAPSHEQHIEETRRWPKNRRCLKTSSTRP